MRIVVRFIDGEELEAESEAVDPTKFGFLVRPTGGNNRLAWVSMAAIKYIKLPDPGIPQLGRVAAVMPPRTRQDDDPPEARGLDKLVLRFIDGDTLRAYRDQSFVQEGHCFNVRILDAAEGRLVRTLVSMHTLKAFFVVEKWDSRSPQEILAAEGAVGPEPSRRVGISGRIRPT